MSHRLSRTPLLLAGFMSLALGACSEPAPPSVAVDAPSASAGASATTGQNARPSVEEWSEQARQTAVASTPDELAAEGAAAGRAMAETCGFTADEMKRFTAQDGADRGAGFEAQVEKHMPRLRQVQQAQKRDNNVAYEQNCEHLRFMLNNRD